MPTPMRYRRFGKTELSMPVLTCGGMRFQQAWQDVEAEALEAKSQQNVNATVEAAFAAGMTHFETARGYGSSEVQLGLALPALPREQILVQTKIGPKANEAEFLDTFETSMDNLKLDAVDLLSIHGINTAELLDRTLHAGSLDACRRLQAEGRVRHVGFSTHGPLEVILDAIASDAFSYVNLHWYTFDRRNEPAVAAARERDMGVFIISPSDKGGKLYDPPDKLVRLCEPLTPMGFNDLFCLAHPGVHTLSLGAAGPSDFDAHLAILPLLDDPQPVLQPIEARLEQALADALGEDWARHWQDGLPPMVAAPDDVPLYQIVRMYNLARAYDMSAYGRMRYNLLGNGDHWFPGVKVDRIDWPRLRDALAGYRFADRIPHVLKEAHAMFAAEDQKRLSES